MQLGGRRAAGIALLAAGLLAFGALLVLNPFPAPYGAWLAEGEGGVLLKSFGPPLAMRYEAGTDTTVAALDCWHETCPVAAQFAGNVTAELAKARHIILFSPEGPPARGEVDLATPLRVPSPPEAPEFVTQMTAARFEVGSAYVPALMYQLAFLAVVVGGLLTMRARDAGVLAGALGVAVGMMLGFIMASGGAYQAIVWPALLLAVAVVGAAAGIVLRKRSPHALVGAAFAGGVASAILFSWLVATRYFAHGPTV